MEYLYEHLAKDLKLKAKEIAKISGAMSDEEQQQIVENFGRDKADVRILVARTLPRKASTCIISVIV